MQKRKRSATEEKNISPSNPFINYFGDSSTEDEESGNNLQSVISFIESTKQKKADDLQISANVNKLLVLLEKRKSYQKDSDSSKRRKELISSSDVASALLPWAIKTIIHSSADPREHKLQWRSLETCLNFALLSDFESKNVFTLSVLQKLIPKAAKIAFQKLPNVSSMAGTCYCRLVDRIYRPTFDQVCDVLLPIIGEHVQDVETEDRLLQSVVISTFRLLHKTLKKANAKKSFQKLVHSETFYILSNVYCSSIRKESKWAEDPSSVLNDLLVDGLFSLEHHIDGFRSIELELPNISSLNESDGKCLEIMEDNDETRSSFHCYQEGLLSMILKELSVKDGMLGNKVMPVVFTIPLLFEAFVQQTIYLKQNIQGKPGKKKSANKIGQLQFRFFATLSSALLKLFVRLPQPKSVEDDLKTTILESLGQNLELVLKHDAYLPSNIDNGEKDFVFLKGISKLLIDMIRSRSSVSVSEWRKALVILDTLTRLNHVILHEDLTKVLCYCLTDKVDSTKKICREASCLLITLVVTYQKLRQLDFFFQSLVEGTEALRRDAQVERLHSLIRFFDDPEICSYLATAIQKSPIHQIKQIFSKMNNWVMISSKMRDAGDENNSTPLSITVIVRVFALLMRYVRIDIATSHEIYPLCHEIMSSSIYALLGEIDSPSSIRTDCVKDGLILCGWTLDLANRCNFWLKNNKKKDCMKELTIPSSLIKILDEAVTHVSEGVPDSSVEMSWIESSLIQLQFLACHRIQQLHGRIHEKQRVAFVTDSKEYDTAKDIAEARKLAVFALHALRDKEVGSTVSALSSRWQVLAGSIASWSPYAEPKDLDYFLFQFFLNLARGGTLTSYELGDEATASLLLRDPNFYEAPNILLHLGPASISCAAELIQKALVSRGGFREVIYKGADLLCPIRRSSWLPMDPKQMNSIIEGKFEIDVNTDWEVKVDEVKEYLFGALRCLMILNGLQAPLWDGCKYSLDAFDSVVRLDLLCRTLAHTLYPIGQVALELVSLLRETQVNVLKGSQGCPASRRLGDKETFGKLFTCLFSSTTMLLDVDSSRSAQIQLIKSSRRLIEVVVDYCIANPDHFVGLHNGVKSIFQSSLEPSENEFLVLVTFGRSIIMRLTASSASAESNSIHSEEYDPLATAEVTDRIQNSLWHNALEYAFGQKDCDSFMKEKSILFLAEILKGSTIQSGKTWFSQQKRRSIEEGVIARCKLLRGDLSIRETRSTSYLVACLALADPSPSTRREIATIMLTPRSKLTSSLENVLCTLLKDMNLGDLTGFLEKIASPDYQSASQLRIFHLLILNLTSPNQLDIISKFSRRFLAKSLHLLVEEQESFKSLGSGIACATNLIVEMASNRAVISIRERDIALILASINTSMNKKNTQSTLGFRPVASQVYDSCFTIVSFLLQRFSKQLFYCVPSLMSTMTVMLRHSLYGELPEVEVINRGQKFSRLCELLTPHADVYKKHVLCIVVEFVNALRGKMDLVRKDRLAPAIYCLLDILQQHEKMQLNSMLDDMGRALLRSVHESYQKIHVYKGQ